MKFFRLYRHFAAVNSNPFVGLLCDAAITNTNSVLLAEIHMLLWRALICDDDDDSYKI